MYLEASSRSLMRCQDMTCKNSTRCDRQERNIEARLALRAQLTAKAQEHVKGGWATSTTGKYQDYQRYYIRFVIFALWTSRLYDVQFVADTMLPCFVEFLALTNSYTAIHTILAGVRGFYLTNNLTNPCANNFRLDQQLKGLRREKGDVQSQKLPITIAILHTICAAADINNSFDIAFTVAVLIAFFAFSQS